MADAATKLPVKSERKSAEPAFVTQGLWPIERLRGEVDRLFDEFGWGLRGPFRRSMFDVDPFWRREWRWTAVPAADITETDKAYYLHERHFGSFGRCFRLPEGVDADKIEASFKKGILTVSLPKKPEAQKPEKKIEVKAAA